MLEFDQINETENITSIKVIGVGGGGGNALNNMIKTGISGVEFIAVNTDAMDLRKSQAKTKLQIGRERTGGRGTGARPEVGKDSAVESKDEIKAAISGTDMIFIAAGMGGGTGTGAAPVIAQIASDMNILTLGVVTYPFDNEGGRRKQNADSGIRELRGHVDTLIVIPNEKLNEAYPDISAFTAFLKADEVLTEAVKAVSDIINLSGYINVDFADVETVMKGQGYALMGTGQSNDENRAETAARAALTNPLLKDVSLDGCKSLLINITAGSDLKMSELDMISEVIVNETGTEAEIIRGLIQDESMEGIKVTVIAAGLKSIFQDKEDEYAEESKAKVNFDSAKTELLSREEGRRTIEFDEAIEKIEYNNRVRRSGNHPDAFKKKLASHIDSSADDVPSFLDNFKN
ncbi:MAG: cell division protein FtsZ [Candidatus Cloacimonadota bacterium]|nr:MAG: cell division protein FtsZ [Candidatus Cloacimonadota bacterium]